MTKAALGALTATLMVVPAGIAGSTGIDAPEGCEAINPAVPTCTFTTENVDTFGGVAGRGDWVVKVKVGKRTTTYKSPASGEPTGIQFMIPASATVTATATSAGSGLVVGGE